jgi:hypothetical protein
MPISYPGQYPSRPYTRYALSSLMDWAFDGTADAPDDELDKSIFLITRFIDPLWGSVLKSVSEMSPATLRMEVRRALTEIRTIAHTITGGPASPLYSLSLTFDMSHRDGRMRFRLHGSLADAMIWTACSLLSETPLSLIRSCAFADCTRIFVGSKNQRVCTAHQWDVRKQNQRRAERAFLARRRAKLNAAGD